MLQDEVIDNTGEMYYFAGKDLINNHVFLVKNS